MFLGEQAGLNQPQNIMLYMIVLSMPTCLLQIYSVLQYCSMTPATCSLKLLSVHIQEKFIIMDLVFKTHCNLTTPYLKDSHLTQKWLRWCITAIVTFLHKWWKCLSRVSDLEKINREFPENTIPMAGGTFLHFVRKENLYSQFVGMQIHSLILPEIHKQGTE